MLSPIGFDSFGLPAENAAIKTGTHPRIFTDARIEELKSSLKRLGASYDWRRELHSHDPLYMRWNQVIFLRFLEAGLAYRKNAPVNWCPGLPDRAGQRAGPAGRHLRAQRRSGRQAGPGAVVLPHHRLRRRAAGRPGRAGLARAGQDHAAQLDRPLGRGRVRPAGRRGRDDSIRVFTTRPDTSFGMTFVVLAPEHPAGRRSPPSPTGAEVEAFVERVRSETDIERQSSEGPLDKRGVFTGAYAVNPFTGQPVPIYLADYVLMTYGTGAIMAVPGQDQRDWEFAGAYDLPIVRTVAAARRLGGRGLHGRRAGDQQRMAERFRRWPTPRPAPSTGWRTQGIGERKVNYRLRDWLLSRQRYWGCPIPVVYCPMHGIVAVPEDQLPVLLPDDVEFRPTGESPLRYHEGFLHTTCPICGGPAERETDTMDTFVDSSWYFERFCDPWTTDAPIDQAAAARWMPVDQYIGGIEHAILHLLYARFYTRALADLGLAPQTVREPFARLFTQGMITMDGSKMSKSRGNLIAPERYFDTVGADSLRLFHLFVGPPARRLRLERPDGPDDRGLPPLPRPGVAAWRRARSSGSPGGPGTDRRPIWSWRKRPTA